jgi:hypothetical protein
MVAMHSSKAVIVGSLVSVGLAATALAIGLHLAISTLDRQMTRPEYVQTNRTASAIIYTAFAIQVIGAWTTSRRLPKGPSRLRQALQFSACLLGVLLASATGRILILLIAWEWQ